MVSGVMELIMRVGCVLLLPGVIGQDGVFIAEVAAWTGAAVLLMAAYFVRERSFPQDAPGEDE